MYYDSDGNMIDDYGNIIHDPWVHEGLKEEEYFAMQAIDRAYTDELHESIEDDYKKFQALNITKNKKYSDFHKIGFNNFKPFGEKIQPFSKKPITLIYGPNSIGKSSFIHMQSYIRYIFETQSFDLSNTDMFGDNINLGGFDKFIHKRDKNNSIKIEFEFDDCSEAIIEYLKPDRIDFTHIEILHKFTTEDILDIINNSEQYIHKEFARLKTVKNSKKLIKGQKERESNHLCNKVYKDELDHLGEHRYGKDIEEYIIDETKDISEEDKYNTFLIPSISLITHDGIKYGDHQTDPHEVLESHYKECPYLYAGYYSNSYGYKNDVKFLEFTDNEYNFINEELKKCFISDILIPKFINFTKIMLISKFKKYDIDIESFNLHESDIAYIAKKTKERIETTYEVYRYNEYLKNNKIPLKISMEIKHSQKLNRVHLKKVEYIIQDTVYDAIEEVEHSFNNEYTGYTVGASYDSYDSSYSECIDVDEQLTLNGKFGHPPIFNNAPEIYKRYLINDYFSFDNNEPLEHLNEEKNKELEDNWGGNKAIFLSYKNGYNKLIGTFNDMLNFNKMQYIGPLRFYPERDASFKELDSDVRVITDSKTSWSLLKTDEVLRGKINNWLGNTKKLKTRYEIKYRKLYDIESSFYRLDINKIAQVHNIVNNRKEKFKTLAIDMKIDERGWKLDEYINLLKNSNSYTEREHLAMTLYDFGNLSFQEQFKQVLHEEGILDQFDAKEEMVFEDLRNNTQISNRDLGLGISQILPVLIATNRNKNMTIAVEQPELHLHPSVQCEIADEFIRSYKENKNEFIIETHSEHLLLRIMKRMRHTAEDKEGRDKTLDLTPDDVCLLYIDTHKGETFIRELKLDKDGSLLSRWPSGFFEESYNEMFS